MTPDTFDYLIIGAGSAGCLLANRLSTNPHTSVCLIEAGGEDKHLNIRAPGGFVKLFKTPFDWAYETEPEPHMHHRRMFWPRGKVLGGCSTINAMIYIRGHRLDYDRWHALGNPGWAFDDLLPLFKKHERNARGPSEFHGATGELEVREHLRPQTLSRAFLQACEQSGIPRLHDFNAAQDEGCGYYQVTQHNGHRFSAADAFIKPIRSRPNLTLRLNTHARRILLEQRRATGIQTDTGTLRARREVLLCAGAIGSPQLLLLSGIGPGQHLQDLAIPVHHHLPGVGENLQDHLLNALLYHCKHRDTLDTAENLPNLLRFLLFRRGPFTSNVAEAGAFLRTQPGLDRPDIQLHFAPCFYLEHGFKRPQGNGFGCAPCILRPHSRGTIRLRTPRPEDPPAIQPNYLDEPRDLETLRRGMLLTERILNAPAFDPHRAERFLPPPDLDLTRDLDHHLREKSETLYHPAGTCKMGNDPQAVVDAQLRVHGIEALRVADAAIMPELIGGNTHAPVLVIAEKAATLIRP